MNDEPSSSSSKTHSATLTLLSVVMVPVLYVLLTPPILYSVVKFGGISPSSPPPQWMQISLVPYQWLVTHGPARKAFQEYFDWWGDIILDGVP